jgi:hypothetical protein
MKSFANISGIILLLINTTREANIRENRTFSTATGSARGWTYNSMSF